MPFALAALVLGTLPELDDPERKLQRCQFCGYITATEKYGSRRLCDICAQCGYPDAKDTKLARAQAIHANMMIDIDAVCDVFDLDPHVFSRRTRLEFVIRNQEALDEQIDEEER